MKNIIVIISLCFVFTSCATKKQAETTTDTPQVVTQNGIVVEGLNLGNKAPEIMQASPSGNVITLSSYKGKLVLVDFWASWCAPCRAENPTVVAAYKKYNQAKFKSGDGFEILSVSLDQNAAALAKAIQKDSLYWKGHVSDLQGWNNAAALKYGVRSIPTNFLVNGEGIIIAKGLRGSDLEQAIRAQLK